MRAEGSPLEKLRRQGDDSAEDGPEKDGGAGDESEKECGEVNSEETRESDGKVRDTEMEKETTENRKRVAEMSPKLQKKRKK